MYSIPKSEDMVLRKNTSACHIPEAKPGRDEGILRSLPGQCKALRGLAVDGGDWSSLMTFLAYHASSENQLNALEICCSPIICLEAVEVIRGVIDELKTEDSSQSCPLGTCS
jgi:hypothetical protein